jgi:hypothetical protein
MCLWASYKKNNQWRKELDPDPDQLARSTDPHQNVKDPQRKTAVILDTIRQ